MKFRCSKEALDKQLSYVSRVVTVRSTAPVLSNVLLETDGQILRMTGTDMELTVATYLPAEIEQEGTFTVPAKLLQEFVRQNPDDELSFSLESFELVCSGEKVSGRLAGLDADEFPSLPKVENGKLIRLGLIELVESLKNVVIACAQDTTRPVLTGVYIHLNDDMATLAATDSFRLVERRIPIVPVQEPVTILVPARTIQEIIRIAATLSNIADVEIEVTDSQALFRIGAVELFSRLLVGTFPKYTAIIPKAFVANAEVATPELIQGLRLSNIFSTAGVANVLVEVREDGNVYLSSHGSQRGMARHTLYTVMEGEFQPLKAAFNVRFLLDAVTAAGASHLTLKFSGSTSPLVIATEDPNYLQLIMPIRLDA
jgi:DNA polymerase-3 subunit beta